MPLITTKGAASAQGFGEFSASADPVYIEQIFSTYLYTGTGSSLSINNGIDLSTKGGLVWLKGRSGATDHALYDTARGTTKDLVSNNTDGETTQSSGLTAFNTTGFTIGSLAKLNTNAATYVSWTFRKQPKFFDVVTWTGDGTFNNSRIINHSINGTVGAIIVKATSASGTNWIAYHRSLPASYFVFLNATNAQTQLVFAGGTYPIQDVTNTTFNVNHGGNSCNASGVTYVAYLFAHDAGGFGLSGTDNVISCGSYTGNGSDTGPVVTLGYEPQWILIKNATDGATNWTLIDNMRGLPVGSAAARLHPNLSDAEYNNITVSSPLPTGFQITNTNSFCNTNGSTYIYIAIRRGPMKVPTTGTSVFSPTTYTGNATYPRTIGSLEAVDFSIIRDRTGAYWNEADRLRGGNARLFFNVTDAETTWTSSSFAVQNGFVIGSVTNDNAVGYINYAFRRAPGFFDVVCYTGNNATQNINHNLSAIPELMICKARTGTENWFVYYGINTKYLVLQATSAAATSSSVWGDTSPTSSVFTVGAAFQALNCVAYLFSTLAGVSKVGSYTGSGTTKQIDCGFTGGARFVLIKRTDSTGDWYVYDSARGIVASTDPYLVLNSTAAEVTTTDWVDTYSAGFELSSAAGNNVNINTASYIFLSIA
jgi:hypothetical protein